MRDSHKVTQHASGRDRLPLEFSDRNQVRALATSCGKRLGQRFPWKGMGWAGVGRTPGGEVLTISLSPVPGASHEVCIWRISPLVPSGPLHGGLWEGKTQGALGVVHSPLAGEGGLLSSSPSQRWVEGRAVIQKHCPAADFNLQGMRGMKGHTQTPV